MPPGTGRDRVFAPGEAAAARPPEAPHSPGRGGATTTPPVGV